MFLEAKSYMAQETELLYVVILVISILVLHLIMTWTDSRRNGNSLGWKGPAATRSSLIEVEEDAHEAFASEKYPAIFS